MYLLCFNALRVLHRTKTGPCARRVRRDPSNPHGQATSETAATGTCVRIVARASRGSEKVPTGPPPTCCMWTCNFTSRFAQTLCLSLPSDSTIIPS